MYIEEDIKQQILAAATLEAVLNKYCQTARGRNKYVCPMCGKPMEFNPSKGVVKCFHCDWGTKSGVSLVMDVERIGYPEALERLAGDFGIFIPEKPYPTKRPKAVAKPEAWYKQQLSESGLKAEDVRAWVEESDGTKRQIMPFRQGTVGSDGLPTDQGDDMIIQYFDLDGHRLQYTPTKNGKQQEARDYFRVRWQIPESHTLRDGSVCKYKSPAGSSVQIYIPEKMRQAYRERVPLEAVYFTEGEKKAEAVSKYVGPAFGLAGINCLVGRDKQLPEAIVRVLEQCQVKKVYFIMDSDWCDLAKTIDPDADVRQRPQAFYSAARNFRAWFETLRNRKLFVDCYLVLGNNAAAKGVDDQLVALMSDTDRYLQALQTATHAAIEGGHTPYFDLYNITSATEAKLSELWHLDSLDNFVAFHRERLEPLESFMAWRNRWRLDQEKGLQLAQPLADDEQFWSEQKLHDRNGNEYTNYTFNYGNCYTFLQRRGHWRLKNEIGDFDFVKVEGHQIRKVNPIEFKDYVLDFARNVASKDVLNMLYRASSNYLGPASLSNMEYYHAEFAHPDRDSQVLYFKSKYWLVNADGIEEHDLASSPFDYWASDCKAYDASRLGQRMLRLSHTDEGYRLDYGPDAYRCDFLRFLMLTSWFDWDRHLDADRKLKPGHTMPTEEGDTLLHFISKLTAIGYLLHHYHNPACAKAVVAMDERISAVGESQGRSGKSLLGLAVQQMQNTVTIPAKNIDFDGDRFLWEEVDSSTRLVVLDDIAINFDFEQLFPLITTSITVNRKGVGRFTLEGHDKPKFYITTNHTIGLNNGSARDRQFRIAFSNYFDDDYKPEREFGRQFFSEYWDDEQWNLFYNLMAECLQIYFEVQRNGWGVGGSGLIAAPSANIERRTLRQQMTETFFRWASEWFDLDEDAPQIDDNPRLNFAFNRSDLFQSYKEACNKRELNFITPQKFWGRLVQFCNYFGLAVNPHLPTDAAGRPGHDKSGGVEYITIGRPRTE